MDRDPTVAGYPDWAREWPTSFEELEHVQHVLASADPPPFEFRSGPLLTGGCFVCFTRARYGPGFAREPAWAAAAVMEGRVLIGQVAVGGFAGAEYKPGGLALREGSLLERAVDALQTRPTVLIVNASGRDHPRRAGLALHLGAALAIPTIGSTRRPLIAVGDEPGPDRGSASPLRVGDEVVGYWVRTRPGSRPIAVHAGWRTDPDSALRVALAASRRARTPEPLRRARRLARLARAWCADNV